MPRRKSYTVEFKLTALSYLDRHGSVKGTAEEFGVDSKMIRQWRANSDQLHQHQTGKQKDKRKLHPGRQVRSEQLEASLLEFFEDERMEGRVVRNKDLQRKAREVAAGLNLAGFEASNMWIHRWKKRHGISTRFSTSSNQKVPADFEDQLMDYRQNILRLRHRHQYNKRDILNMDQTMVRFDMAPRRTNERKGAKHVRIKTTKGEKRGFTVALCAAADGGKLPAFVI